jgi:Rieske Fe-S protein
MDRRGFGRLCLAGVTAAAGRTTRADAAAPSAAFVTRYDRVLLATSSGEPLRAGALAPEEEYLFFYPFASTPCLLVDLGQALPETVVPVKGRPEGYAWGGGVGPRRSIAAFTAICPHEWSHPDRKFAPIRYYRSGERPVLGGGRDRLIVCCVHGSTFDPGAGGRLEQAPAELPLASVLIEWDQSRDELAALGLLGPDSFERFFRSFTGKSRAPVTGRTPVTRLAEYSATLARC